MDEGAPLEADDYLADCFRLARMVWEDDFRPDFMVALWRGGAPPGIVMQEYFRWRGHDPYHTAIRTQSLEGVLYGGGFDIKGLEHVIDEVEATQSLLIIDDLFETGRTTFEVCEYIRRRARRNTPEIRVAAVYFRRSAQRFLIGPHYWLHETDERPVFPHQLTAMDPAQLANSDAELAAVLRGDG
jgi:hypoxanthine phosphoribosyltransferase